MSIDLSSVFSPLFTFLSLFFFFNAPATTEIYTLSLHDALPISASCSMSLDKIWPQSTPGDHWCNRREWNSTRVIATSSSPRSEEHTSELQSRRDLVCRLLLEKKKNNKETKESITKVETINIQKL